MAKTELFVRKQSGGMFAVVNEGTTTGNIFFVDSGSATGADSAGYGQNPDAPVITLDYAIGLCTANNGDIIYLMPGHNESLTASLVVAADVAGVTVIGLGSGADMPRFDYDNASGLITISAASVTMKNIQLLPSVTGITKAISVTGDDITLDNITFMSGEDGAAVDEFTAGILIAASADRCTIKNCTFNTYPGDASANAISLTGANVGCVIRDNVFNGAYSTAAISGITAAASHVCIVNNYGADVQEYTGTTGVISNNGDALPDFVSKMLGNRVGCIYYVNGGSDGPTDNYDNGTTLHSPKQTITAALAKCVSGHDDYIFIINYGGNARAAETWPIACTKDRVHFIGVTAHAGSKWATVTATGSNKSAFEITGARCEIANLEIGGTAAGSGAGILVGNVAGVWGLYVHDCWFGVADGAGTDGIRVGSTFDAPYLCVEKCEFGNALLGTGILITGVATRGRIVNNVFVAPPVCINVAGSAVGIRIMSNKLVMGSDAAGKGISLSAGTTGCFITDNQGCFGDAASSNNPFLEGAGSDANHWGINYKEITATLPT